MSHNLTSDRHHHRRKVTIHIRSGVVERVQGLLAGEWQVTDHDECATDEAKQAACRECSPKDAVRDEFFGDVKRYD